ncbi:copper-translocating P-type ATPase [Marispirochaeta aestuarii]|uniref:P-type Zn(2+) transporter n=1 Tax=Marispirochaeta aestuarii TaxID=1963862 RepID=A0A1Y1S328_9SPIO|nr:cation-translocating P-type ATPase [Marispirochaeta aestuarii]ORC38388.1 copper-translocating P-type ATPase [Marispirochaeta aestuarii]
MNATISRVLGAITTSSKGTVITAGGLIIGALAAGWLLKLEVLWAVLMGASALVSGLPITAKALRSLGNRHVGIELLVSLAMIGAILIQEYWEAAAVTFLFNLGGYLEARTMARTRRVIRELIEIAPSKAILLKNGEQISVPLEEIQVNDILIVKPGGRVPVDGEVKSGSSSVNESAITGEPLPVLKQTGDSVFAGTQNENGVLTLRATGIGEDTTLARIIHRVEEAQEAKAPAQRFMERFARWYTPLIIGLSGVIYLVTRDPSFALTVLVIGCPGALVISTPVSIVAGIGGAARQGILMKGGTHLETSGKIDAVALDKTGTLTLGDPRVERIVSLQKDDGISPDMVLFYAAIAESASEHPIAGRIVKTAEKQGPVPPPTSAEAVAGKGIKAAWQEKNILVGSRRFMEESGINIDQEDVGAADIGSGETMVFVALDDRLVGLIGVADPVRSHAKEAVARMRSSGVKRIVMLTGDNRRTAQAVARQVGITEVHAELLPEEKLAHIRALQEEGFTTAMVGDGINDAPALASADVGIAMGDGGTDIAMETADIALMRNDLTVVAQAIERSRGTLRNIRQNIALAIITVTGLLIGVLSGNVHMAGGMLIHEASVMLVILNGMRLLRPAD